MKTDISLNHAAIPRQLRYWVRPNKKYEGKFVFVPGKLCRSLQSSNFDSINDQVINTITTWIKNARRDQKQYGYIYTRYFKGMPIGFRGGLAVYSRGTRQQMLDANRANIIDTSLHTPKPVTRFKSIGIEIEFLYPSTNKLSLWKALYKHNAHIGLKSDGSIRNTDDLPASEYIAKEINICLPTKGLIDPLKEICKVLQDHDACVNRSCGLHVHLDCRALKDAEKQQILNNFINWQTLLFKMQPHSRRNNSYCKKRQNNDLSCDDRYYGINTASLRKFGTIEIRIHSATTDYLKIKSWTKLLNHIAVNGHNTTSYNTKKGLKEIGCSQRLIGYVFNRVDKFKTKSSESELAA